MDFKQIHGFRQYLCSQNGTAMKFYLFYIKYRLWIGLVLAGLAVWTHLETHSFWTAFILYLLAVISILGHFLLGPLRLIQGAMEAGDMVEAKKVLDSILFPRLLIKPIRSVYYTIQGNLAMVNQDYEGAEKLMKKGLSLGSSFTQQAEGPSKLQLGMLAIQKGDLRQGESYIRQAIRAGLPDDENNAAAYLQLCSIMMNKREFRAAKEFFRKAKSYKPVTPQIVDQIKQIEKYITRMPG